MTRAEILATASRIVTVDRAATHGNAENQFTTIAAMWSALIGAPITAHQVALMQAMLKVARAWGNPGHGDNWVDLAGYAACGGEIATSKPLPREGLPFDAVKAERDAAVARSTADWAAEQPLTWTGDYRQITSEEVQAYTVRITETEAAALAQRMVDAAKARLASDRPAEPIGAPPDGLGASDLAGLARREHAAYTAPDGGVDGN